MGFVGERGASQSPNLKSALEQPQVVHPKLGKECEAGRINGPFLSAPFPKFLCSPLVIVPKKPLRISFNATLILPQEHVSE